MARTMTLGGKPPQIGNNVSHSQRKTKRKWEVNMQTKTLFSSALDQGIRLTIPNCEMRTVDRAGGLDNYLLAQDAAKLSPDMRRLQDRIRHINSQAS